MELSRVLYSGAATIGSFRCDPRDHRFRDSGPAQRHLLVFPREPVVIQHAAREPVVADRSVVMTYNQHQAYTREAITPAGDRCEWFGFPAETIAEARGADSLERPFGDSVCTRADAGVYLLARRTVAAVASKAAWLDEACLTLLDRAVRTEAPRACTAAHRDLARAAQTSIARHFTEPWSLGELAQQLGVSTFHLARVFRAVTGHTIHKFRTELRVRAAVERILDGEPLATLALELGFSSHSHFTQAFRATFGIPPSKISTARLA